jgi:hypothetical protein
LRRGYEVDRRALIQEIDQVASTLGNFGRPWSLVVGYCEGFRFFVVRTVHDIVYVHVDDVAGAVGSVRKFQGA